MTQLKSSTGHELKNAISDELSWTPSVNCDRIGVAVADGAVTLSGQVATYSEKQAATSAALRVRGVCAVADEIVVQHARLGYERAVAGLPGVKGCRTGSFSSHRSSYPPSRPKRTSSTHSPATLG